MLLNLFTEAPQPDKPEPMWAIVLFGAHGLYGLGLLGWSIAIYLKSRKSNDAVWRKYAIYGMLSIIIATIGGLVVGATGEGEVSETASFVMSLGFILAFISYVWYLVTKR